jgi:hypothetical protein
MGASIESTLELWASSLREVKGRMRRKRDLMAACEPAFD